ncbi:unnamed protein product, partial [Brassica rapa subsp. trilocularis]
MTTRRKRRRKEINEETTLVEVVDEGSLPRHFAEDHSPSRRLNVYSKVNYYFFIRNVFEGTLKMDMLL